MLIFSSFQFAVLFLLFFQEVMQTSTVGNIIVRNLLIFLCCKFGGFRVLPLLITLVLNALILRRYSYWHSNFGFITRL